MFLKRKIRTIRKQLLTLRKPKQISFETFARPMSRENQPIGTLRRVVYTCLFGYSERFLDQELQRDEFTDFVCFTDDKDLRSDFWKIVLVPKSLIDTHRRSKGFKHRPHMFFPNHESSLYIDNTVKLTSSPSTFFEQLEKNDASFMMYKHPERNCVYDEAEVVKALAIDDVELIDKQMNFYRHNGFKENSGLHATTVMLRKHNDSKIKIAMDEWHNHVLRYSKRDQLSFDSIRTFYALEVKPMRGSLVENDFFKWPIFLGNGRLPRNFDDAEYLKLNPDVAKLKIHPRKHYLELGMTEGRPYRVEANALTVSEGSFRVDPKDERGRELQRSKSGQLNEPTYAMWEMLLKQAEWTDIFDIGANYGEMLVRAAFPPSAKVLAFEPNPRIFPLLRENLEKSNVKCDCLAIAVSDQVGIAELCIDLRWSGLSSLEKVKHDQQSEKENILVPAMSVDALMSGCDDLSSRRILMKIDVEGHEIPVLEGMRRVSSECQQMAALVEVLHLNDKARTKILMNYDVEIFDLATLSFLKVEQASLEQFESILGRDTSYKNDIVIRPRRQ